MLGPGRPVPCSARVASPVGKRGMHAWTALSPVVRSFQSVKRGVRRRRQLGT